MNKLNLYYSVVLTFVNCQWQPQDSQKQSQDELKSFDGIWDGVSDVVKNSVRAGQYQEQNKQKQNPLEGIFAGVVKIVGASVNGRR